jgi:hypothetical protein
VTLLKCAASCGGAYNVFEASVSESGGHVPSARRGSPERNGWLKEAEEWIKASAGAASSLTIRAAEPGTDKIDTSS